MFELSFGCFCFSNCLLSWQSIFFLLCERVFFMDGHEFEGCTSMDHLNEWRGRMKWMNGNEDGWTRVDVMRSEFFVLFLLVYWMAFHWVWATLYWVYLRSSFPLIFKIFPSEDGIFSMKIIHTLVQQNDLLLSRETVIGEATDDG